VIRNGVVALLAALLLGVAAPAAAQAVRVGTIGVMADIGLFVALERGYFAERGLKIETVPVASAADVMAMVATNQLEFVGGGFSIALFNAVGRGLPVRAIVGRGMLIPGWDNNVFLVRQDIADAIRTARDLKGRKIALNSPVSALVYVMGKSMESAGLTLKDADIVNMPFPSMATAFSTRAIDVALVVEPFAAQIQQRGVAVLWKGTADFVTDPYMHISTYLANPEWSERNPKLVTGFVAAYLKGLRVYYDALTTGKGREEIVGLLIKNTPVKDPEMYKRMIWQFADPNGVIGRRSIEDQIAWYHRNGMITKPVAFDQVVETRYLDAALKEIGTVPCPRCIH
jgi:NitT/TauT family transport system substrate-binding protein